LYAVVLSILSFLGSSWKGLRRCALNFNFFTVCKNAAPKTRFQYQVTSILISIVSFLTTYASFDEKLEQIPVLLPYIPFAIAAYIYFYSDNKNLDNRFLQVLWFLFNFYTLSLWSISLLILNEFSLTHFLMFCLNTAILVGVVKWQRALVLIIVGYFLSYFFINLFIVELKIPDFHGKLIYTSALISFLIFSVFLSPYIKYSEDGNITTANSEYQEEKSQEELDEEKRQRNNLSHELRTPIIHIKTAFNALAPDFKKKDIPIRDNISITLNILEDSLNALYGFTNDAIDSFEYKQVNLIEVANEVIQKHKLEQPNIEFLIDDHEIFDKNADSIIQCHEETIIKALDNLMVNSINNQSSSIEIAIKQTEQFDNAKTKAVKCVQVSVIDNGNGFNQDIIEHALEPFVKDIDSTGSGLGLALVNRIVSFHQGFIKVENNYGLGACVTFAIPKVRNIHIPDKQTGK